MPKAITEPKKKSSYNFNVELEDVGQRLDKYLSATVPELSRSRIQALLEEGALLKTGKVFDDASYKVRAGDNFELNIPEAKPSKIMAKEIPLDIVYEDKYLLVINKQAGLTVHPGAGNRENTLVNALLAHCKDSLSGIGGVERPGIVHRLDKDTTGLMVVAKDDATHKNLAEQIQSRELKRVYIAVVWGLLIPHTGKISANIERSKANRKKMAIFRIGGKAAITHYKTLKTYAGFFSEVECRLETGRTHQIRIHMAHQGNSLVGDGTYGSNRRKILKDIDPEIKTFIENFPRQALHSSEISFGHPKTRKTMHFKAKIPEDMQDLIQRLKTL